MEARKIIITGGADRIGAAIAEKLSGPNKEIVIHYNKSKLKAENLKKKLQNYGSKIYLVRGDLSKEKDINKYPNNLKVFNGRGGQEIVDNFLAGCSGIIPSLEGTDFFLKIYKLIQQKKISEARKIYKNILPSIVFSMQSIDSLVCYGKRICAYRMGINKVYDRRPGLLPTTFGIKLAKDLAKQLGKFN